VADDSKASNVGDRYARALFDLATDQKQVAAVEADLMSLKAALAESKDLRTLLGSPAFGAEAKGKGLEAIAAKAKFNATTRKFLGLLSANRRASANMASCSASSPRRSASIERPSATGTRAERRGNDRACASTSSSRAAAPTRSPASA